jgi:hypothetical protein
MNFLTKEANVRGLLTRIFLDDWLIKLFAVIITLSLWFGVTGLRAPITTRLSGVDLKPRVSSNLEITNSPVTEVDLIITGDKRKIDQINPENLIISLDLTDVSAGDQSIQLTPENINIELPPGVKIEDIQPSKIAIKLEPVIEREVPVIVETEGNLPEGYEFSAPPTVIPAKVSVRGPASFVNSLTSVSTERIDLTNRYGNFIASQVPLNVVNSKVTQLTAVVDVSFNIKETSLERTYLVAFKTDEGEKKVKLVLYGERSLFNGIEPENFKIETVTDESGNKSLKAILPEKLQDKVEIRVLEMFGK